MFEYSVKVKCGHVGKNKYIIKTLPVVAKDRKEAAKIARETPRVKHHWKDAVIEVERISKNKYMQLLSSYYKDPFFRCSNIQEQRKHCLDIYDDIKEVEVLEPNSRSERVKYLLKKRKTIERLGIYWYG